MKLLLLGCSNFSPVVGSDDIQYVLHSILLPEVPLVIFDDGRQILDVT